ncbi:MAG: DUF3987 domain-containing protein [Burkholderiales bacterium]
MQCPPDYPAAAVIVMLRALLGNRIGIRPKRFDSRLEVANLWGAVVGRSGWMKSPALAAALKPLSRSCNARPMRSTGRRPRSTKSSAERWCYEARQQRRGQRKRWRKTLAPRSTFPPMKNSNHPPANCAASMILV